MQIAITGAMLSATGKALQETECLMVDMEYYRMVMEHADNYDRNCFLLHRKLCKRQGVRWWIWNTILKVNNYRVPAVPQQGDLRLSGPPSGQGAGSGARTRDRRIPADLRADSQATVLPTPP
ncbi:hypothetical protein PoB_003820000 [Plakobranchus ocellatus]|uniref:Uncharacterized protein n=1 Tax=Plakobranchus ocellatus TaxID=259542 RepID=A0AAV4ATN2_9GAST|nr:hypothetical protein PoB_003820000 [Plakobranchus ocellatus]